MVCKPLVMAIKFSVYNAQKNIKANLYTCKEREVRHVGLANDPAPLLLLVITIS